MSDENLQSTSLFFGRKERRSKDTHYSVKKATNTKWNYYTLRQGPMRDELKLFVASPQTHQAQPCTITHQTYSSRDIGNDMSGRNNEHTR